MGNKTFDEVLQVLKESGEEERKTIEIAEELARVVDELSEARVKKHLTQRDLAELSGIKQSAIARMESLQAVPRLDTMIKLARCLNVRISIEALEEQIVRFPDRLSYHHSDASNNYPWDPNGISNIVNFPRKELSNAAIG